TAGELVRMTERALGSAPAPEGGESGDRRELVAHPGREDERASMHDLPAGEPHREPAVVPDDLARLLAPDRDGLVCVELLARSRTEVLRWRAVGSEDVVHVAHRRVAVVAVVEDDSGAMDPAEAESGLQTGRSAADDHDLWMRHAAILYLQGDMKASTHDLLLIHDVATRFGLETPVLRHWEGVGLLAP